MIRPRARHPDSAPAREPTNQPTRFRRWEQKLREGQVLILFALFSFVLVGFTALSIDAGFILAERRQIQSAADAAALAAAKALLDNRPADAVSSAQAYATFNAGPGATVQVVRPPASGIYAGDNRYIQVTVTRDVRRFFVGAVYNGPWRVTSSAVAGIEQQGENYALITLNRSRTPGIYLNGNTGIVITGNNASAMSNTNIASNGTPSFTTTGYIDAASTIAVGGGAWNPANRIRRNQPQIDDPLAGVSAPPKGTPRTFANDCPNRVCQPGWYRNQDVTLSGTYTFLPGIYYFENSDVGLQNTNATINGNGVIFYFDSNSTFDPKNGNVNLRAPSGGAQYTNGRAGMVFWYAACNTLDMQGNANLSFTGIFYAPCADVQMRGTPGQDTISGQMFVGTLDVRGTADLRISYNNYASTTRPKVFLVE
jgi:Flp pilus assembly protein TadG